MSDNEKEELEKVCAEILALDHEALMRLIEESSPDSMTPERRA